MVKFLAFCDWQMDFNFGVMIQVLKIHNTWTAGPHPYSVTVVLLVAGKVW